jgi:MFS family permease
MTKAQAPSRPVLITSAIGGWAAGVLADKYGRVRMPATHRAVVLVFTFLSGFTHPTSSFVTARQLDWGNGRGSVLVAEMIQRVIAARPWPRTE